jgi:hypothetical protein
MVKVGKPQTPRSNPISMEDPLYLDRGKLNWIRGSTMSEPGRDLQIQPPTKGEVDRREDPKPRSKKVKAKGAWTLGINPAPYEAPILDTEEGTTNGEVARQDASQLSSNKVKATRALTPGVNPVANKGLIVAEEEATSEGEGARWDEPQPRSKQVVTDPH